MGESRVFRDGTGWQVAGGYSRAVRRGPVIAVSGTTANGPDGTAMFAGDTYAQTQYCLDLVLAAINRLGGSDEDVIRTRIYLAPEASWEDAARAHGERFADIVPANTTVFVAGLVGTDFLVEIEAEAVLV